MEYLADYRESIRMRDKLDQVRHERNVIAVLAVAGWLALLVLGGLCLMH